MARYETSLRKDRPNAGQIGDIEVKADGAFYGNKRSAEIAAKKRGVKPVRITDPIDGWLVLFPKSN